MGLFLWVRFEGVLLYCDEFGPLKFCSGQNRLIFLDLLLKNPDAELRTAKIVPQQALGALTNFINKFSILMTLIIGSINDLLPYYSFSYNCINLLSTSQTTN